MNKIKRDKSIPTWAEVISKQDEGPSSESTSEDLMEEVEKEREEEGKVGSFIKKGGGYI